MDIGSKQAIREFHHGISKIDDGMTRQRTNIAPLGVLTRWEDLEPTQTVEEDGDAAKVGVLPQGCSPVIYRLRRRFDEAYLVAADCMQAMEVRQR